MSASEIRHTFWQQGDVCCCLVTHRSPLRHAVQVCVDRRPFFVQTVEDPDEGAGVAERFWIQYADARDKPAS